MSNLTLEHMQRLIREMGPPLPKLPDEVVTGHADDVDQIEELVLPLTKGPFPATITVRTSGWMPRGMAILSRRPTLQELRDMPEKGTPWVQIVTGLGVDDGQT